MNTGLWWHNIAAWSAQIAVAAAAGALLPLWLGGRLPALRLRYCQFLLAACLALPLLQNWRIPAPLPLAPARLAGEVVPGVETAVPAIEWEAAALAVMAAGAVLRLAWLVAGLVRLRRFRRRGRPWEIAAARYGTHARVCLSDDVASPVTFGVLRPVILLPSGFPALDPGIREAVLCHEFLHVRRRDWLFVVAEEIFRAAFWFHPAVWWVLSQIQLAREQAVDAAAVRLTNARERYLDALLAIAGAGRLDVAPAPLFLKKRHLAKRVACLVKEVHMSRTSLLASLGAGLSILMLALWLAAGQFPLRAAPQESSGPRVVQRAPVRYPAEAKAAGVEGVVLVEATVDVEGRVTDAGVLSGPDALRKAALQSVLDWRFANDTGAPARSVVTITFTLSDAPAAADSGSDRVLGTVRAIETGALTAAARDTLVARLPLRAGDEVTQRKLRESSRVAREIDDSLRVHISSDAAGFTLRVAPAPAGHAAQAPADRIRVGGNLQHAKRILNLPPSYPIEAKLRGIQGTVSFEAVIGKDGRVAELQVLDGQPLLAEAAAEAVYQWTYQPTLLNGNPVEVLTRIDVNFTLAP